MADKLIETITCSFGEPTTGKQYTIEATDGQWWIERDGERQPLKEWLKKAQKKDNLHEEEFEEFWEAYDKKKGKKKAWLEWKKLSEDDIEQILQNVPVFKTHFSDKQYLPYPRKYLYNRYWEDDDFQQPKHITNGTDSRKTKGDRRAEILREDLTGGWIN